MIQNNFYLNNILKCKLIVIIILTMSLSCAYSQSTYRIINKKDIIMQKDTFDIDYFENNKDMSDNVDISKDDGEHIWRYLSFDKYVEIYTPPLPKFYTIYKEYYLNGNLKTKGFKLKDLEIGTWEYYDEKGKKTTVDKDKQFSSAKFTYNQVMLLLNQLGEINIQTGENRENVDIHLNKQTKQWYAKIRNPSYGGNIYIIDAKNGKIVKKGEIISN